MADCEGFIFATLKRLQKRGRMRLRELKGIGEKTEQLFAKVGVTDTSQLPFYFPRSYDVFKEPVLVSEIEEDGVYTIYVSIFSDVEQKSLKKLTVTTVFVVDDCENIDEGSIEIIKYLCENNRLGNIGFLISVDE